MYLVGRSCRITTNRGVHRLSDSNIVALDTPDRNDPLQEVLREGARRLLKQAVEAELAELLQAHRSLTTDDGKPAVVRNGYLPARTIQTGLRSEEHTSELQSRPHLVCRLLLEKKNNTHS